MMFFIKKISLPLQCVFHSIRFKVNKVGVQRYSFFSESTAWEAYKVLTRKYLAEKFEYSVKFLNFVTCTLICLEYGNQFRNQR